MSALPRIATAKADSRKRSRRVRPFIEKRYRRDVEHARARALCSDLVYWLARRSRKTIQIMVAVISVPPRADASAQ